MKHNKQTMIYISQVGIVLRLVQQQAQTSLKTQKTRQHSYPANRLPYYCPLHLSILNSNYF